MKNLKEISIKNLKEKSHELYEYLDKNESYRLSDIKAMVDCIVANYRVVEVEDNYECQMEKTRNNYKASR